MNLYYERLKNRARVLGNHHRKYLLTIENHYHELAARLEKAGLHDRVHLWVTALDYKEEMGTVAKVGSDLQEKLNDLGTYFALQYLQMHLGALDALILEVRRSESRMAIYKEFMLRIGHDFRALTAAYMEQLLKLFLPEDYFWNFVFLSVGTRSDQDDIDVGVVDSEPTDRALLNKAISRMNTEMLKHAVSLHFHLSEHVGSTDAFSASIPEYCELLEKEIRDFVIITEMLGAARILGSRRLVIEFRRKVTARYYYDWVDKENNRYHEGYLRGILGEVRSFMLREFSADRIIPKTDGLRMIKTALYAAKTIYGLRQVNAWAIIEELQDRDKRRREFYNKLEQDLTFLEIFRYLYQLYIAQEEEILYDNKSSRESLSQVAHAMGYRSAGVAAATDFLLADYYFHVKHAKEIVKSLLPYAERHLKSITIFGRLLRRPRIGAGIKKPTGNLALRFLDEMRFFRGTRFWDDVVSIFAGRDGLILQRFINDMCVLDPQRQAHVLEQVINWGWNSFITTFSFIVLLHKYRTKFDDCRFFQKFNELFFSRVQASEEVAQRISIVFNHYPMLVKEYVSILTEPQQRRFYEWLKRDVWDREVMPVRDLLRFFIKLHFSTSYYFKRSLENVLSDHPEYLRYLIDPIRLQIIGNGSLAEVEREKNTHQKLKNLKFYYYFQFFRISLDALAGVPAKAIAFQYSEFSDSYLRLVFDTCKHQIDEESGHPILTADLFGVFITGGQGQMQAYDDDYDLIIVLNSDDPAMHRYYDEICRRVHREIIKSGIMPHYRLADFTGSYISTFSELKQLLTDESPERFIDKSQLLGSRMVVGSNFLRETFEREIIEPYVFHEKNTFIRDMLHEIDQRHVKRNSLCFDCVNLKEDPGGLRDIEMLLLILRAFLHQFIHSNFEFLTQLPQLIPQHARLLSRLQQSYEFLRRVRNLNRLTVAADDNLDVNHIGNLAASLQLKQRLADTPEKELLIRVKTTMRSVLKSSNTLFEKLIIPRLENEEQSR